MQTRTNSQHDQSKPGRGWQHAGHVLGRRLAYVYRRLMRVRATPHEVALGCAAGIFAAFTPFLGFQMLLAGVLIPQSKRA